jgi:hypothetical protein
VPRRPRRHGASLARLPRRRWAARWHDTHEGLGIFEAGYPVTVPDDGLSLHLALDGPTVARKVRALAAQATQTAALMELLGPEAYAEWVSHESFVDG